jgi:delta1-piperideine-2-carboxylate reductase
VLAISPELVAGPDWAEHCEKFFRRFDAIEDARLPGSRRRNNRTSTAPREIDADLVERIRTLCRGA